MPITTLLVASGNRKKLAELTELLTPLRIRVVAPADVGYACDVAETGTTFAANAILKAEAGLAATGLPTLADDSGIEARALGWRPGVYSARYAGEPCDDAKNNAKLVAELHGQRDRYVRYQCVLALARPQAPVVTFTGTFAGEHVPTPRGDGGFGYDPYVLVPELQRTVAELTPAEKHARSHRGQAVRAFLDWLARTQGTAGPPAG